MSIVFLAESKPKKVYLSLPAAVARHVLIALDYDIAAVAREARLLPSDVLLRIDVVRRQFVQGRGDEFTCDQADEGQMLAYLQELEKVARRAHDLGKNIVLL
jgi:hypothetical protein